MLCTNVLLSLDAKELMGKLSEAHIDIHVELDEDRVPVRILWHAKESEQDSPRETKAMQLSCWDEKSQQTLRMELWTKHLRTDEMKRFYIDMLGGMSQGILSATGDTYMSDRLRSLCKELSEYHRKELSQQSKKDSL